ncbi:MAG: VOC family protein [Alphaproteobacteria bacterium]|nr:VOC family protein [Alphaproteobacteria bacterium]
MLDHSRIICKDMAAARRFYAATARPLGFSIIEEADDGFAVGPTGQADDFVLLVVAPHAARVEFNEIADGQPGHVALPAKDDYSVRAFFRAALEAGGTQVGYPAPQPTSAPGSYYAARVIDPNGNLVECGWHH